MMLQLSTVQIDYNVRRWAIAGGSTIDRVWQEGKYNKVGMAPV